MAGYNNDLNINATSIGNGVMVYAEIKKDGETPVLFELGTLKDIKFQSERQTGSVTRNGSDRVQKHQRGIRMSAGAMVLATIGKRAISAIKESLGDKVSDNLMSELLPAESMGPGVLDIGGETTIDEESIVPANTDGLSLVDLPPLDIVIIAKADIVSQLGILNEQEGIALKANLDYVEGYNQLIEKRISGLKFSSDGSGANSMSGFDDQKAQFMVFGKVQPWKKRVV